MTQILAPDDHLHRIPVDQDYVVEPPVWGDGRRSRNWLAVLDEDPQQPGGIVRTFCARGRGRFRYSTLKILTGDLIEFGADYVSSSGFRHRERWYGVVLATEQHALVVRHYKDLRVMLAAVYRERAKEEKGALNVQGRSIEE